MKTSHLCLLIATGGLFWHPKQLLAQDKPTTPPPPGEAHKLPPPGDAPRPEGEHGRHHRDVERHGPEMKPTAYIGVMTRPLAPEVRAQTSLKEGFGLLVEDVMPDSPAKTSGLQQNDVLVLLGDQQLINQEQLAVLVRSTAKDSDIVFTIKRAGAEQKVTVKVGEKLLPAVPMGGHGPGFHPFDNYREGIERFNQDLRDRTEHFQRGMHEYQNRMQEWQQQHGRDQRHGPRQDGEKAPPPPTNNKKDDTKGQQGSATSHAGATVKVEVGSNGAEGTSIVTTNSKVEHNVTRRDDSGEYSLHQDGGSKTFTVKPTAGEEKSFPVSTDEERKAVPEEFKVKLKELDEVSRQVKVKIQAGDEAPAGKSEDRTKSI